MSINPPQCRAARGLLGWSQDELTAAVGGGVSKRSIVRFERDETTPQPKTLSAIRTALEAAGVEFIAENGGGAGVRLKIRAYFLRGGRPQAQSAIQRRPPT